ncbi:MAG TPA: type II toxin-antitoxin system HipA family toxin [Dokdonella sp.]|nr:type II toxin-antitoxin system HipA family toxin [Dokdonella sp.]
MSDTLDVRLFGQLIAQVGIEGDYRSPEEWRFQYRPDYLASTQPIPLSVTLPLQDEPFAGAVIANWFGNLLPEGAVRETIERRLRLPPRDNFALLVAIGGECAGAVSVGPEAGSPEPGQKMESDLETLIREQGNDVGDGAWAALGSPRRLSLAGAQDKIAVIRMADGRLTLPAIGEPSTHILKPESRRLPGLRDLEALGLRLARAIGLNAVQVRLVRVGDRRALLVERYDRTHEDGKPTSRLHQEDFCQALGYPAELKYESLGGPSLARCADLIRNRMRLGPNALQQFLDWVAYSVIIGNADAHAKNLSLLYTPEGGRQLAPCYDLLPILTLPESMVDREPALRIGIARRIDAVTRSDWQSFAMATGYAPRFVLDRVATLAHAVAASIGSVSDQLVSEGADAKRLEAAVFAISGNADRVLRQCERMDQG